MGSLPSSRSAPPPCTTCDTAPAITSAAPLSTVIVVVLSASETSTR